MEYKNVLLEKENNIAIVTINRPKALNALNTDTLNELELVVDEVAKDDDILVVILTGAGEKAFVAGADISEMKDKNVMEGRKFGLLGNKIFRKVETLEKPVIAAINGFALGGGCELSMACDIRIASQKAKFGQPEVSLGITPGFGGTQRLARHVGMGMAKELIYSAKNINADEALRIGLVNKVVAPEELMKEAKKLANEIAGRAPIAVKLCKQAINRGIQVDIDTAINIEAEIFGECFSTEDQKDAMTAFVEKRKLDGFKNR
ncbi:short-chain-enoyl-CoA hydratase [Clostridium botulinum]|uniref:short-chain-enoyl-CoA hydratase n=1 Tax=Clostridium botulinum TaxID=1491 RepID=A0A9Q1UXX4_CLOBO|nr:short-chain-enoyl-CoA hydratase [Clostridium botulinum]AEB76886.1 Enoyl-CoA hydratase/isomerase [Clostridium botulinum BKT015925]KEH97354.1 crotonase [Clostridium botulinum D str. 16868]KEI03008.1 crotonase [Clostridium botulinum C/D str. Sp77]KLU75339.1 crotonase [Clostridium botulinum V891]KOA74522.1 crotonase [Clostridium botulinum]